MHEWGVDWSGGGRAPRGLDLSWARLDLVLLHGEAFADALVESYLAAGGSVPQDFVWWDLYAATNATPSIRTWAPNHQGLGRVNLDGATLAAHLDLWLTKAVAATRSS